MFLCGKSTQSLLFLIETAERAEVLDTNPSVISGPHMVEGENRLLRLSSDLNHT